MDSPSLDPAELTVGRRVRYFTGNAWRYVTVLRQPKPGSKSVLLSGFRYKHGGLAKPRRVYLCFVYPA